MIISQEAVNLIKNFEGFSAKVYSDPGTGAAPYTQGYGSTERCDGTKLKLGDPEITTEVGEQMLLCYLNKNVLPLLQKVITTNLNQKNIDSLSSLIYNIGGGNFSKSTVLKLVNQNIFDDRLKTAFLMWNKAAGKVMTGLTNRRLKEYNYFIS